jgi:hypothetical protein
MDLLSIAAIAAPFVAKGAEVFSKTAGEKFGGLVGDLCQAVIKKFKGDTYAEQTLARANEKPESEERQGALKGVLAEKMKDDPDFAEKVQKLVQDVQKEHARTVFDQRGQTVHGSQTNIGEINAPVFSGTFSGPVNQHFWAKGSNSQIVEIDNTDKRILMAMAPGGASLQSVDDISKLFSIKMKELQERLTILAGTTPYVKDEGNRNLLSTGPEMVSLTPSGLKFVRDNR